MGQGLAHPILRLKEECLTCMGTKYSEELQDGSRAEAMDNPNKVPLGERKNSL